MSSFELGWQFVQLTATGVVFWYVQKIRSAQADHPKRYRDIEERIVRLERRLDAAVEHYSYLDQFKPKDEPDSWPTP